MRKLGVIVFVAGLFASSFVATRHVNKVEWQWFVPAAVVMFAGVVLLRMSASRDAAGDDEVAADVGVAERSLAEIGDELAKPRSEDPQAVFDVADWIDGRLIEPITQFVNAREAIGRRYGLDTYGAIMDRFARGERNVNRAWCAAADGYVDEVRECLARATTEFAAAREELSTAKPG